MSEQVYDVIIVGGRVAGSTLAARLGQAGRRVLLLERAQFPSLPAVSSPIVYASTLSMLDEIGADERVYAHNTPRLHALTTVGAGFTGKIPLPLVDGRDYAYAVDRARFDAALWQTAVDSPGVTGYQNATVQALLWDAQRVVGVRVKMPDETVTEVRARAVIGADGRFGLVARKTGAQDHDRHDEHPTSIYYAYWHNVAHLPGGPSAVTYVGDGRTHGYLAMDSADNTTVIAIEGRSDALVPRPGDIEGSYLDWLRAHAGIWQRLQHAERVTSVRGMRDISNCYRQPGGPGWALVGDAYHQKDPLDGQGIYNAVVTARLLARSMKRYFAGHLTWEAMLADYDEAARVKTYPMYKRLLNQVQQSFYPRSTMPPWLEQNLVRWTMQDPQMHALIGKTLTRQLPPDMVSLLTPPALLGAMVRGSWRDLRARWPFA